MIVDHINHADRYTALHPLFEAAFAYIRSVQHQLPEPGKIALQDKDLFAIYSLKDGVTAAAAGEKFECHDHYIDIQFCTSGDEQIGWKYRPTCTQEKAPYNPEKDVTYFLDQPDCFIRLQPGQFAIFYPEDVHAPMISNHPVGKLVLKVKI